jgi:hypothetical protein
MLYIEFIVTFFHALYNAVCSTFKNRFFSKGIVMNHRIFFIVPLLAALLAGCSQKSGTCPKGSACPCPKVCPCPQNCPAQSAAAPLPVMVAKYTPTPIKLDGSLDDPAWKNACVYTMYLPADVKEKCLAENGEVRLAWDDQYLYIGVKYYDSDIIAEGRQDQLMHFELGDLCEVFVKNDHFTWYWELYGTPLGYKTNLFFPGSGHCGLPSAKNYKCGLKVAAQVKGTVNNWKDKDDYFTVELAMPIKDLTALGGSFGPGEPWRILVARYNYSRYIDMRGPELSSSPKLAETNYHLLKGYARLCLEK